MRIDITRSELEAIVNALSGNPLKCERKIRSQLFRRLSYVLTPSKAPDKNGWAPIRIGSSWPSGVIKPSHKPNWSFHKPRDKKPTTPKVPKKPLTADDILAEL
jgi:hypothetical protein